MNKTIIGLLVIAAIGAGTFYFLQKKNNSQALVKNLNKEWIIGKWKVDSFDPPGDSTQKKFTCEFTKEVFVMQNSGDSVKADSLRYKWTKDNELQISALDSSLVTYRITKLTADSLQWLSKDSLTVSFQKAK